MKKHYFVFLLKFLFTAAILWWLLRAGNLDFNLFKDLKQRPFVVITSLLLLFLQLLLNSLRWQLIINNKLEKKINILESLKMNWIGAFFCSFLPGSVTGDLVKLTYLRPFSATLTKKTFLAAVFIDRLCGLGAIVVLAGLFAIGHYHEIFRFPLQVQFFLQLIMASAIALIFLFAVLQLPFFAIQQLYRKFKILISPQKLLLALLLSCSSQMVVILIFGQLIYIYLPPDLSYWRLVPFILSAFVTTAIPIAPSGIGVGHAAFAALFALFSLNQGANFFSLYLALTLSFNLLGAIPFTLTKKKA
jgi:glycosyltransferase 2 family protein